MRRILAPLAALFMATTALSANPIGDVVEVDILPGWRAEDGSHMAGLRVRLADGWKTYWRAPGDAGIPPAFDWTGSTNLGAVSLHWPVPEVTWSNGMRSIVYDDQVVIPMRFVPQDGAEAVTLQGRVQLGVCEEICVPVELSINAVLPVGGSRDPQIMAALLDRPRTAAEAGVGAVTCALAPTDNGLHVAARIEMPPQAGAEVVVIEAGDQAIWVSEPESRREGAVLMAEADMIHATGAGFAVDRSAMRITVLSDSGAVDIQGCTAR